MDISIHAPRVGSDPPEAAAEDESPLFQSTLPVWGATSTLLGRAKRRLFQSTLPVWGATRFDVASGVFIQISIHAPRVGSDRHTALWQLSQHYFNPRSPCGERQQDIDTLYAYIQISIHAPRVGSDIIFHNPYSRLTISIHAPRVGSDALC